MFSILKSGKLLAFIALLLLGTIIAVAHNQARSEGHRFAPEDCVRVAIKPLQVVVHGIGNMFGGVAKSLRSRNAVASENERLRKEVKQLSSEVIRLKVDAAEAKRLRAEIGFKTQSPDKLLAARVISRSPSEWFVTATIDHGSNSGVTPCQAVLTPRGLIGQVFESSGNCAQIRGLTDSRSGVGAMIERSRCVGICQGQDKDELILTRLKQDADVKPGDIVITSGQGGVVPKGIPIGRIIKVSAESGGFMKSATVRPSVRFDEIEEVFVNVRKVK